jgi:hypothetical protein
MSVHATDPQIDGLLGPYNFYRKVKNGGAWDLKQQDEFNSATYGSGFIFDGKNITRDAPGNIHYGYVGAAADWANPDRLLGAAGAAQVLAGTSQKEWINSNFHGDDPVDQVNILWGINMYYNR